MCYGLHVCVLKVHMNSVTLKIVSNGASLYLGAYYIIKVASLKRSYSGQRSRLHGKLSQNITEFRTLDQAIHKCIQVQLLPSNPFSVVRMSCVCPAKGQEMTHSKDSPVQIWPFKSLSPRSCLYLISSLVITRPQTLLYIMKEAMKEGQL